MLVSLLTLGLAALAYALPSTELVEADTPDPNEVYFQDITWLGTGCTSANTGNYTSGDRQTLTLEFDAFVASIGPGVAPSNWRKNCQLNVLLHYPGGFQYSILDTIFRGYVLIDANITATQEAVYYFSGGEWFSSSALSSADLRRRICSIQQYSCFHRPIRG
jgi:acetyl esterase/lipase